MKDSDAKVEADLIGLKKGKLFKISFSIPRIIISAIREFRMSLSFAYHLKIALCGLRHAKHSSTCQYQ